MLASDADRLYAAKEVASAIGRGGRASRHAVSTAPAEAAPTGIAAGGHEPVLRVGARVLAERCEPTTSTASSAVTRMQFVYVDRSATQRRRRRRTATRYDARSSAFSSNTRSSSSACMAVRGQRSESHLESHSRTTTEIETATFDVGETDDDGRCPLPRPLRRGRLRKRLPRTRTTLLRRGRRGIRREVPNAATMAPIAPEPQ